MLADDRWKEVEEIAKNDPIAWAGVNLHKNGVSRELSLAEMVLVYAGARRAALNLIEQLIAESTRPHQFLNHEENT